MSLILRSIRKLWYMQHRKHFRRQKDRMFSKWNINFFCSVKTGRVILGRFNSKMCNDENPSCLNRNQCVGFVVCWWLLESLAGHGGPQKSWLQSLCTSGSEDICFWWNVCVTGKRWRSSTVHKDWNRMIKEAGKDCKNFQTEHFKVENEAKVVECSRLNCVGACVLWNKWFVFAVEFYFKKDL